MRKPGGPHQPERIVGEDPLRDRAEAHRPQVGKTGERVDDVAQSTPLAEGHSHRVHREVALAEVGQDIAAPHGRHVHMGRRSHHTIGAELVGKREPGHARRPGHAARDRAGVTGDHHVGVRRETAQLAVTDAAAYQPSLGAMLAKDICYDPQHLLLEVLAAPALELAQPASVREPVDEVHDEREGHKPDHRDEQIAPDVRGVTSASFRTHSTG